MAVFAMNASYGRQIWYKKQPTGDNGKYLYIYLDETRKQKEKTIYGENLREEYEGLRTKNFFATHRRSLFAFVSNLDTDCTYIYLASTSRWDIKQCEEYGGHFSWKAKQQREAGGLGLP